ncbi:MAG: hypothetical protein ABSG73_04105 [Candidatus Aminicenantales bacterium]|jgi:hypothetical protein
MRRCVWCGHKGIFLRVDSNNLCPSCQEKVYPDIKARTEFVLHCYKRLKETEVPKVKLSLANILLAEIDKLRKYEAKHIPVPDLDIDLRGVFANTKDASSLVEIKVDAHREEGEELKTAMDEYNKKYGKLPDEIYSPSMGTKNIAGYLKRLMEEHERQRKT